LLLLVTLCAVLSVVPAVAAQGTLWVAGLTMALFAGIVLIFVGMLLYVMTMLVGHLLSRSRR